MAVAELGVPIYITETGIADAKGDRRALFLDTYVPQARPRSRPTHSRPRVQSISAGRPSLFYSSLSCTAKGRGATV